MSKYVCTICGYVYDEEKESVLFNELPQDWKCPLCGADKSMFKIQEEKNVDLDNKIIPPSTDDEAHSDVLREMNYGELSAICSNLSRGCEKQYLAEEASLFTELSEYYASKINVNDSLGLSDIKENIIDDIDKGFPDANSQAELYSDRGAKRVLVWSEKVTRIMESLLSRYEKEGTDMLKNTKIWVCDICGFIFIGDNPPEICPICKVPNLKILEVR